MLRAVVRLAMVSLAVLFAAMTALFVLLTLGLEHVTRAVHGQSVDAASLRSLFQIVRTGLGLASSATLLPALAVVLIGEVARTRSLIYYVLGGGAALAAIPLLSRLGQETAGGADLPLVWQVFATAGFAGGLVYWLLAGRRA